MSYPDSCYQLYWPRLKCCACGGDCCHDWDCCNINKTDTPYFPHLHGHLQRHHFYYFFLLIVQMHKCSAAFPVNAFENSVFFLNNTSYLPLGKNKRRRGKLWPCQLICRARPCLPVELYTKWHIFYFIQVASEGSCVCWTCWFLSRTSTNDVVW